MRFEAKEAQGTAQQSINDGQETKEDGRWKMEEGRQIVHLPSSLVFRL